MALDFDGASRLNQFAVVFYIPDPLGRFLDDLRLELAPDCRPRAHVSVLPPRPLPAPWTQAAEEAEEAVRCCAPFEIAAGRLALFPETEVVYLEVASGARELQRLHDALANRALAFDEPYIYHPHITVAQELAPGAARLALEHAAGRWEAYDGPRAFRAETAVFVQNTAKNHWVDLVDLPLGVRTAR